MIPHKIPKTALVLVADALASSLEKVQVPGRPRDWDRVFYFAMFALGLPNTATDRGWGGSVDTSTIRRHHLVLRTDAHT